MKKTSMVLLLSLNVSVAAASTDCGDVSWKSFQADLTYSEVNVRVCGEIIHENSITKTYQPDLTIKAGLTGKAARRMCDALTGGGVHSVLFGRSRGACALTGDGSFEFSQRSMKVIEQITCYKP